MSAALTLPTSAAARDLATFVGRAQQLDGAGSIRLIADSGVLAAYVAVVVPKGLLDRGPTVLGLRTLALAAGECDAVVPLASFAARLERAGVPVEVFADAAGAPGGDNGEGPVEVGIPAATPSVVWSGIAPPRGGWSRSSPLPSELFGRVAREGAAEVAQAVPEAVGQHIVDRVRSEVWGRPMPDAEHIPAGAAFALHALGFLGDDEVQQFTSGSWLRLTTKRGHVLVKQGAWSLGR